MRTIPPCCTTLTGETNVMRPLKCSLASVLAESRRNGYESVEICPPTAPTTRCKSIYEEVCYQAVVPAAPVLRSSCCEMRPILITFLYELFFPRLAFDGSSKYGRDLLILEDVSILFLRCEWARFVHKPFFEVSRWCFSFSFWIFF